MDASQGDRTAEQTPRRRRKVYLINPSFQWKYTLLVVGGVFLVASYMSVMLFGVLHQQARERVLTASAGAGWSNVAIVVIAALAFSAVLAAALGLWSIIVTHRICGPLYVIGRSLSDLAEGRFPGWRPLRKHDEFKELHELLWCAVDDLKAKKQLEHSRLTEALNIARSAADADDERRQRALKVLATHLEVLRDEAGSMLGDTGQEADASAAAGTPSKSIAGRPLAGATA